MFFCENFQLLFSTGILFISSSQIRFFKENVPVCVQTGDGGLPVAVQVLRLLQEDVVEDARDVDGDVVLDGLQHRHVGPHAGQQFAGLGDLLSCLVVHGHPHYGPGDGAETDTRTEASSVRTRTSGSKGKI